MQIKWQNRCHSSLILEKQQAQAHKVAGNKPQSVKQNEPSSSAKPTAQKAAKASTDKVVSSRVGSRKDVVLLPKAEPIPSQRRRRQPSQQLSQSERLQAAKSEQAATSDNKAEASKSDVKPLAESKPQAAKAKQAESKQAKSSKAAVAIADKVIPKSDRVPATRRRREPSSTISVSERVANEKNKS